MKVLPCPAVARLLLAVCAAVQAAALLACAGANEPSVAVSDRPGALKTAATARADRRAFDGAPPVIPHPELGAACVSCHHREGVAVAGLGFAPPSPHEHTTGLSEIARCRQCHVEASAAQPFAASSFAGFAQDLGAGRRWADGSPPVIPHPVFLRESCTTCHSGPAAREEIRTSHPERPRCRQCHVEQLATNTFPAAAAS